MEIKELPVAPSPQKRRRAVCASRLCARLQAIKGVSAVPGEGMCTGSGSDAVQTLSVLFQEECQDTCKGVLLDCKSRSLLWRLVCVRLAFNTESVPEHGMDVTSSVLREKAGERQENQM